MAAGGAGPTPKGPQIEDRKGAKKVAEQYHAGEGAKKLNNNN
jgi:hypothetical protein